MNYNHEERINLTKEGVIEDRMDRVKTLHRQLFLGATIQIVFVSFGATLFMPHNWEIFLTSLGITFISNFIVSVFSFHKRSDFTKLGLILALNGAIVVLLFWNLFFFYHPIGFMIFEFAAVELALLFISMVTSSIVRAVVSSGARLNKEVALGLKVAIWGLVWFFHLFVFVLLYLYRTVRV